MISRNITPPDELGCVYALFAQLVGSWPQAKYTHLVHNSQLTLYCNHPRTALRGSDQGKNQNSPVYESMDPLTKILPSSTGPGGQKKPMPLPSYDEWFVLNSVDRENGSG